MRLTENVVIYPRFIAILLLGTVLGGCSTLFESDNQEPPAELVTYSPSIAVNTMWSVDTGAGNAGQSLNLVPAISKQYIFVADYDGLVQAVNIDNGEVIWSTNTKTVLASGPGLGNDKILLGTRKAEIIALSVNQGQELWRTNVSSEVLAIPRAAESTAVVYSVDGRIYGLNADTGKRKWIYNRDEPALTLRGSSSPVLSNGTVTAGLSGGILVSLILATGEPRWETVVTQPQGRSELERIVDIDTDPLIQDGQIYVATYQGEVVSVDSTTGTLLWHRKMSVHKNMATDGQRLYVTDATSRIWALDMHSGAALWQQAGLLRRNLTSPAVVGEYVVIGDLDGYVHWLSREDGSQLARTKVSSSPITTPPLVKNSIAYIYTDNGILAALTAAFVESPK